MTSTAQRPHYSVQEYVDLEEHSPSVRHEYWQGEIFAMAGGTLEHAALCAALSTALGNQLKGRPCRVFSSDARVRVAATGLITYPDVSVACGHVERDPQDALALVNPVLVAEVLSPSTQDYDRGAKMEQYKLIPSLREIVLVAHEHNEVEVVSRQADGSWQARRYSAGSQATVPGVDCVLDVTALYADPMAPALT